MSLSTTTSKVQYTGNGVTTSFAYPFYALDQSFIKVTETVIATGVDTVLSIGTHYTVSGASSPSGGNVVAVTAPASTKRWTIERVVPYTQLLALSAASSIPVVELEKALDKIMMSVQQLAVTGGISDRAIRYKSTEPSGYVVEIPSVVDRKGKTFFFNATTGALEVVDSDDLFADQIADIEGFKDDAETAATNASASASSAALYASQAAASAASTSAFPLWLTGTSYTANVSVIRFTDEKIYRCATTHTSGTFSTDLGAGRWVELSPSSSVKTISAKTANYPVLSSEFDYSFTNTGATSMINFLLDNLPVGFFARFIVTDSDGLSVQADAGETIRVQNLITISGGKVRSTEIGAMIELQKITSTQWNMTHYQGTSESWEVETS